jgi:hypothetical protein
LISTNSAAIKKCKHAEGTKVKIFKVAAILTHAREKSGQQKYPVSMKLNTTIV